MWAMTLMFCGTKGGGVCGCDWKGVTHEAV